VGNRCWHAFCADRLGLTGTSLPEWYSPANSPLIFASPRPGQPARAGRIRWWIRTGALLSVIGLIRLGYAVRTHWWVVTGCVLTIIGVMMRGNAASVLLLPGLVLLLSTPLIPATPKADRIRRSRLERELAVYTTPAQRRDLETTLDRYPDGDTYELRDILARQAMTTGAKAIPGSRRC
jgi:hypothetical protein